MTGALVVEALVLGQGSALRLRLSPTGGRSASTDEMTVELFRWSSDAERAPLLAALAPASAPPSQPSAAGRAGRGGRGAPPPSPLARLTSAVKAAPTVGYVWGDGATGYSIRYAWRHESAEDGRRIVLVTDRRLGAHWPSWTALSGAAPEDADFTLVELRLDGRGYGEGKTSSGAGVVTEPVVQALVLDGYAAAPVQLQVTP